MANTDVGLAGRHVKDMYGSYIGVAIGAITNVDGSIKSIGVDSGSQVLQQIPFEQIVVQGDIAIYIPKWRLESQRILKEKELTLRRLRALIDVVSDNDEMKEDAEIIREKCKSNLIDLKVTEKQIKGKLVQRLFELNEQMKSIKMFVFDANVQFKSNEISEQAFESVKKHTAELIEHITHETSEISNTQRRIADLDLEVQQVLEPPRKQLQESAVSYLDSNENCLTIQAKLPEAPTNELITQPVAEPEPEPEPAVSVEPEPEPEPEPTITQPAAEPEPESEHKKDESDWLARMEAQ